MLEEAPQPTITDVGVGGRQKSSHHSQDDLALPEATKPLHIASLPFSVYCIGAAMPPGGSSISPCTSPTPRIRLRRKVSRHLPKEVGEILLAKRRWDSRRGIGSLQRA